MTTTRFRLLPANPDQAAARAFWSIALALALILLIPFLVVDVPPVLDYPNHLARFFVLAQPHDPILSRFYAPHWGILPNLGFDLLGMAVLKVLPVHIGGRLLLATAMLAPPLGVVAYGRVTLGPRNWWPLAGTLAAFNGVFFLGFLNFLLSLGLAFGAAALWLWLRRRGWALAIATGMIASALLFLCHIFGVLLFGLLIGCAEVERLWDNRRNLSLEDAAFVPPGLLVAVLPAFALYCASPLIRTPAQPGEWSDAAHKIWEVFTVFMTPSKPITLLTGLAVFAPLILWAREARFAPGARSAFIVLALIFVAAPNFLSGGTFLDMRLALMAGLLLFAGIAPRFTPRQARAAGIVVAALLVLRVGAVTANWMDHELTLSDLRAAMADVPAGARVIVAQGPADAGHTLPGLYRLDSHLPALLVIERKAFWPLLFADPRQQPIEVRPPYAALSAQQADLPDWPFHEPPSAADLANAPYLADWRRNFDYLLVIDSQGALARPGLMPLHLGPYAALWRIVH
jgi:hypothetical protein